MRMKCYMQLGNLWIRESFNISDIFQRTLRMRFKIHQLKYVFLGLLTIVRNIFYSDVK